MNNNENNIDKNDNNISNSENTQDVNNKNTQDINSENIQGANKENTQPIIVEEVENILNSVDNVDNKTEVSENYKEDNGEEVQMNNQFQENKKNDTKENSKIKRNNLKKLPALGIAAMLIFTSVLGGVVGSFFTAKVMNSYQNGSLNKGASDKVTKEDNLDNKASTISTPKSSITEVAEKVGPAVVGISTTTSNWLDQSSNQGSGSGIVFDSNGYIVTNQHVIAGGTKIMVSLPGGKKVEGKIIGEDAKTDLAVIKVEANNLPAAKFGNSDNLRVGDTVIAIGNPLGEEFAGSVTSGIVSAKNRNMSMNDSGQTRTYNVIQTDASINPGNSGGALLNENGEVVGINTLKINSAEGMGFAIPINEAKDIIKGLVENGYISRPFLGVATVYLDPETSKAYGIPSGMGVKQVVPNSAAYKAGIVPGDIIIEVDGKKVEDDTTLTKVIEGKKVGDTLTLKLAKEDGSTNTVKATLTENQQNKKQ